MFLHFFPEKLCEPGDSIYGHIKDSNGINIHMPMDPGYPYLPRLKSTPDSVFQDSVLDSGLKETQPGVYYNSFATMWDLQQKNTYNLTIAECPQHSQALVFTNWILQNFSISNFKSPGIFLN